MEIIYNNLGIQILKNNDKYILQYDGGEIVSIIKQIEIAENEANAIKEINDSNLLYDYMIKNLNDRI